MKLIDLSNGSVVQEDICTDPITLFCQFFIDTKLDRAKELRETLAFNMQNPNIAKIILLNERIYSDEELGCSSTEKLVQVNLGKRLQFSDVFKYIAANELKGFHIIANSDIFFDESILNLRKTDIHLHKKMYALLRTEYNPLKPITQSVLYGPRIDSQDTWIFHSSFPIAREQLPVFEFEFGKPGCDNKLVYLMKVLGFNVINDPFFIKTYHHHTSNVRNYINTQNALNIERIMPPYGFSVPYNCHDTCQINNSSRVFQDFLQKTKHFTEMTFDDNTVLHDYIAKTTKPFVIPRIAGIENNYALLGQQIQDKKYPPNSIEYIQNTLPVMKNNAGIFLSSTSSIIHFSNLYLKAFQNCELYTGWEYHGDVYRGIAASHHYVQQVNPTKQIIWAFALDIFHYIYTTPWTHALRGKRILIISAFEDSIQEKIPIREKIYGIDLFPDCEILTIKPPQTQGTESSREFNVELANFCKRLDLVKDKYDVALVSCGGYGNLVCNYIYETHEKSAIYVGGVLQMYFGILGERWVRERPDIVKLFMNEHWSRPKNAEKPKDYEQVEGSCYW